MKRIIMWLALACLLAACGGADEGPPLGDFPPISKKETDPVFTLVAPSSKSGGAFVFTSSNPAVAVLDGPAVTIRGVGETTITASQPSYKSYGPTHTSTTLTVAAVPCDNGKPRVNGTCVCVSPATAAGAMCMAPASVATATTAGGRIWARVAHADTWTNARDYCAGTVIDSVGNWRLPTAAELAQLFASGAIAGHGWALGGAWSSAAVGSVNNGHVTVDLGSGAAVDRADTEKAYVSCVR